MRRTGEQVLKRLFDVAATDTGQARRVADFLLSWHNSEENGGWDPTDLWNVDDDIADDILAVLTLLRERHVYAEALGLGDQMYTVWERWRASRT
jgi:hypothetical protein